MCIPLAFVGNGHARSACRQVQYASVLPRVVGDADPYGVMRNFGALVQKSVCFDIGNGISNPVVQAKTIGYLMKQETILVAQMSRSNGTPSSNCVNSTRRTLLPSCSSRVGKTSV